MIEVIAERVDVRIPQDDVRIIALQPFIVFPSNPTEPFQWAPEAVGDQIEVIKRTLELGINTENGVQTRFVIFPEYSIPGIDGVTVITSKVENTEWPNNSIVIGGIHGITKTEYGALCSLDNTKVADSNHPDTVGEDQWINCSVTWIKSNTGEVAKWVQPKICPAWPEQDVNYLNMYNGSSIFLYQGSYDPSRLPCMCGVRPIRFI